MKQRMKMLFPDAEYLKERNIHTVAVVGLQTDYCIDATIKCGFEHGFKMIVSENSNSTFDNAFMSAEESYRYYNEFMRKNRYAGCISAEETIDMMKNMSCRTEVFHTHIKIL